MRHVPQRAVPVTAQASFPKIRKEYLRAAGTTQKKREVDLKTRKAARFMGGIM